MQEKARNLIYLDTHRYLTLRNLKSFFPAIIIIPFIMVVWGIVAINTFGVDWKSLFPLVSIAIWSLLYCTFVLIIQSKKLKKTFELRFLVNGISGLFVSSLFWILYASLSLLEYDPAIGFKFPLWILLYYLFFSILYIGLIILGVHKDIFRKIKEISQTPKFWTISVFFAAILPSTGVIGMYTSRLLRAHACNKVQDVLETIAIILLIFIPISAHINFVQYFYCKKYKISCDEYGNTTSPYLEPMVKANKQSKNKDSNQIDISAKNVPKKKIPLILKILIGIICVPIILFVIVFLVFFIKGFIPGIS